MPQGLLERPQQALRAGGQHQLAVTAYQQGVVEVQAKLSQGMADGGLAFMQAHRRTGHVPLQQQRVEGQQEVEVDPS